MKLSALLAAVDHRIVVGGDPEITEITCDSRAVKPGTLFVALPGARVDGHNFVPAALSSGAAAIVALRPVETGDTPLALVDDPRYALALLSAAFFGRPAEKMTVIGLTGTKGKTTTAHILKAMLEAAGHKTAMIGTVGYFIGPEKVAAAVNTTPESVELHRFFARALSEGCTHFVMEVSSQAIKLHRTAGILFDAALFLNLSPDHIGGAEHKDYEEYRTCKSMLFSQCKAAAGNVDDEEFPFMFRRCTAPVTTFGFSPAANIRGGSVAPLREEGLLGSSFTVEGIPQPFRLNMPGEFNVSDALAALSIGTILNLPEEAMRRGLVTATVKGRTEVIPLPVGAAVIIDYAHNGVSFASLLSTLKSYRPNRLIALFGAGGDRPVIRRTDAAREAANYADFAIVTADNPRSEPVEDICAHITAGLEGRIPSVEVYDRGDAIRYALAMAQPGDIIALLGKGHEEYIEINGTRYPFSERQVVEEWLAQECAK